MSFGIYLAKKGFVGGIEVQSLAIALESWMLGSLNLKLCLQCLYKVLLQSKATLEMHPRSRRDIRSLGGRNSRYEQHPRNRR